MKRATPWLVLALTLACGPRPPKPSPASPLEARYLAQPADAQVNFELGLNAERAGDFLRAEQYYRRSELLSATAELKQRASHRIVVVLIRAHRLQEALERCRQLLRESPSHRPTRFLLAAVLASLDHPREAERELETLRRSGPDDAAVYLELGKLYRDLFGDRPRADLMFRRYLALLPSGPEADGIRFEMETRRLEAQDQAAIEAILRRQGGGELGVDGGTDNVDGAFPSGTAVVKP